VAIDLLCWAVVVIGQKAAGDREVRGLQATYETVKQSAPFLEADFPFSS
jgi:hypothetical protein